METTNRDARFRLCVLATIYIIISQSEATVTPSFNPKLTVESCTMDNLVVRITNASDTGVVYILGQGEDCKQDTSTAKEFYEFDFGTCGVQWQMLLRVVIQKKKEYQTGDDKKIPVLCIADTSDIISSNILGAEDKFDDNGLNITVRPRANMKFFTAVSQDDVSGREVKLTDRLIMTLKLEEKYIGDFDIKARYCVASDIVIIDNFCATEPELFPNFWKFNQGYLVSEFGAFRSTSLEGGSVRMNFTCVLQLCKGFCTPEVCNDVYDGWGRRRRSPRMELLRYLTMPSTPRDRKHDRHRRQSRADRISLNVGGTVDVVDNYSKIKVITETDFCWEIPPFAILMTALTTCIMGTSAGCVYLYRKLLHCKRVIQKLKNSSIKSTVTASDYLKLNRGNSMKANSC